MSLEIGTTLGQFEITGLLGKGGMGEVYRARDTKLGRNVAIKVLPESVAGDAETLARFEREAKLLASLSHANVGAIHEFRHEGDVHFLVMELVEGDTLGDRIAKGKLSLREALPIFVQIARGLDAAHEVGIVHRDLKPDNIKISPKGEVKVLDFGIAKQSGVRQTDPSAPTTPMSQIPVTGEGTLIGTPQYMSPEQARGSEVDRRTDVWAFGCCLYEALTGQMPFTGSTISDIVAAILEREVNWSILPSLPPRVDSVMRRSMNKDAHKRLSSMSDIAILLEEAEDALNRPADVAEAQRRSLVSPMLASVVALVIGVAGTFAFMGGSGENAGSPGSNPGAIRDASPKITTIAVLPFENYSGDESQEYFANGMTETLTDEIAKIGSITVKARTSAMRYKGTDKTPDEIATELGVEGLIEGSIQRTENEVRIIARLVDGTSAEHIWAGNFDGTIDNILRLQGEVAIAIASELDAVLSADERSEFERAQDVNPAAWELYLQAKEAWLPRTPEAGERTIALLKGAIAAEPEFADALALLGRIQVTRPLAFMRSVDPTDVPEGVLNAHRALKLDPDSTEARISLAWVAMLRDNNWGEAKRHLQEALAIDPDSSYGNLALGLYYHLVGDFERARPLLERAVELDPHHPLYRWMLGLDLEVSLEYSRALESNRRALEISPNLDAPPRRIAMILAKERKFDAAFEAISNIDPTLDREILEAQAYVFAMAEMQNEAEAAIESLYQRYEGSERAPYPASLARLGREDEALDCLANELNRYSDLALRVAVHSEAETGSLWDNPRYWDILAETNIPHFPPEHPAYEHQQRWLADESAKRALATQPKPVRRYSINLDPRHPVAPAQYPGYTHDPIGFTPDGKELIYVAGTAGNTYVVSRPLDSLESHVIRGTKGARFPIVSPDGTRMTYHASGAYWLAPRTGGRPERLLQALFVLGAIWDGNDRIITGSLSPLQGLLRYNLATGERTALTELDPERSEILHAAFPRQEGSNILFGIASSGSSISELTTFALNVESGQFVTLLDDATNPYLAPDDLLVYAEPGQLMAAKFDTETLSIAGPAFEVTEPGMIAENEAPQGFGLSSEGTLAYVAVDRSGNRSDAVVDMVWVDMDGNETKIDMPVQMFTGNAFVSMIDGKLEMIIDPGTGNLHSFDPSGQYGLRRLSFGGNDNLEFFGAWDRSKSGVIVEVNTGDHSRIERIYPFTGEPNETLFETTATSGFFSPFALSPEDNSLIGCELRSGGRWSIVSVSLDNPTERRRLGSEDQSLSFNPALSPDGNWLAYVSDPGGRLEVYVTRYPSFEGTWQVSFEGGDEPIWAPDGAKLYYRGDGHVMAVDITLGDSFRIGASAPLFADTYLSNSVRRQYDIHPDGTRFLMLKPTFDGESSGTEIIIVENWFEVLKEKARAAGALD